MTEQLEARIAEEASKAVDGHILPALRQAVAHIGVENISEVIGYTDAVGDRDLTTEEKEQVRMSVWTTLYSRIAEIVKE